MRFSAVTEVHALRAGAAAAMALDLISKALPGDTGGPVWLSGLMSDTEVESSSIFKPEAHSPSYLKDWVRLIVLPNLAGRSHI
jgi:hypothetical protein